MMGSLLLWVIQQDDGRSTPLVLGFCHMHFLPQALASTTCTAWHAHVLRHERGEEAHPPMATPSEIMVMKRSRRVMPFMLMICGVAGGWSCKGKGCLHKRRTQAAGLCSPQLDACGIGSRTAVQWQYSARGQNQAPAARFFSSPHLDARDSHVGKEEGGHAAQHAVGDGHKEGAKLGNDAPHQQPQPTAGMRRRRIGEGAGGQAGQM